MKIKLTVLIAASILAVTSITSCGMKEKIMSLSKILNSIEKKEEKAAEISPDEAFYSDKTTEEPQIVENISAEEPEEEKAPDYQSQFKLIEASFDKWSYTDCFFHPSFTVTDLDGNGLLEVITVESGGTGMMSIVRIYEVSEGLDNIYLCEGNISLDVDFLIFDSCDVYIDNNGKKYYALYDGYRHGWADQGELRYAVSFENSTYNSEFLSKFSILTDENFNENYHYYDVNGNETTKEYYTNCYENRFAGFEKSTANFGWIRYETDVNPGYDSISSSFEIFYQ